MSEYPDLDVLDQQWVNKYVNLRGDPHIWGWEPHSVPVFTRLLDLAVPYASERSFLEVGCGIATKCEIAKRRHNLDVAGVEIHAVYAREAERRGIKVFNQDAVSFEHYRDYGIVYQNATFRDRDKQDSFEVWLQEQLNPGQVLIRLCSSRIPEGWETILDETDVEQGVWRKLCHTVREFLIIRWY